MTAVLHRATIARRPGPYESDICLALLNAETRGDRERIYELRGQLMQFIYKRARTDYWGPFVPMDNDLSESDT